MAEQDKQTQGGNLELVLSGKAVEKEGSNEVNVLINMNPPATGPRTPLHIVAVVDVSGSMGTEAVSKNKSGQDESQGLNLLDIVKHAVRTVIHTLGPNDLLSVVAYHTNAAVTFEGMQMTPNGQKQAVKKLEELCPLNSTNIWDGLHTGLEVAKRQFEAHPDKIASLLLLTDGQPNQRPPRGEQKMFEMYKDKNPNLRCTVNTIGFGYSLDSKLLRDLAVIGNGAYAFIPDASLVGTIFVNLCSNLLTTFATDLKLSIEPTNGAKIKAIQGGFPTVATNTFSTCCLGNVNLGQSRDLTLTLDCPNGTDASYLHVKCEYTPRGATAPVSTLQELNGTDVNSLVAVDSFRLRFADEIRSAMEMLITQSQNALVFDRLAEAQQAIACFLNEMMTSDVAQDPKIAELIKDLSGQATEAFSKEKFFKKWGRHYLPSLFRAHMLQQCNNFKDPGVQVYGGKGFHDIRDVADEIFLKLPAPKPSIKGPSRAGVQRRSVNMNSYYSSYNPCFDGYNSVQMKDNSTKLVKDLRKGDQVKTPSGFASVRCVIKTLVAPETDLVQLSSGLLLTPWHPIRVNGVWKFPADQAAITTCPCEAVYSFILDRDHVMLIEGVECVALGHGFTDNSVIKHPFFGTNAIVDDLQTQFAAGWTDGLITFNNNCMNRDQKSGLLTGFNAEKLVVC